jgi:hypothetical protein
MPALKEEAPKAGQAVGRRSRPSPLAAEAEAVAEEMRSSPSSRLKLTTSPRPSWLGGRTDAVEAEEAEI